MLGLEFFTELLGATQNGQAQEDIGAVVVEAAKFVVEFRPMSLFELFELANYENDPSAIKQVRSLESFKHWLQVLSNSAGKVVQESVGTIFLTLALASGTVTAMLAAAKYFQRGGSTRIHTEELERQSCFCLDYLHSQSQAKYKTLKTANATSKWLCDVCSSLNRAECQSCEVCASPRSRNEPTQERLSSMSADQRAPPPPPSRLSEQTGGEVRSTQLKDAQLAQHQELTARQSTCVLAYKSSVAKTFGEFGNALFTELGKMARVHMWGGSSNDTRRMEPLVVDARDDVILFLAEALEGGVGSIAQDTGTEDASTNELVCILQIAKLNLRRLEVIGVSARHAIDAALAQVFESEDLRDDDLKSEVLANQLELFRRQGPKAVTDMMHKYPGSDPIQSGGCWAFNDMLSSASATERVDLVERMRVAGVGSTIIAAMDKFRGNLSVLRPALSVLAMTPSIVNGTMQNWGTVVHTLTAVFQNETLTLHCMQVLRHICMILQASMKHDLSRATINLVINALRNHMSESIQEEGMAILTSLSDHCSTDQPSLSSFVTYLVDMGGVHTVVSAITLLEHVPKAKRNSLELLSKCMLDVRSFNDIQVPVALDCMKTYPSDFNMQTNVMHILDRIITVEAKRWQFERLEGMLFVYGTLDLLRRTRAHKITRAHNALFVAATALISRYLQLSTQNQRGKFGGKIDANSSSHDKGLSMCAEAIVFLYKALQANTGRNSLLLHERISVEKSLMTCFVLTVRALVAQDEIDRVFNILEAKVLITILDDNLEDLMLQRDGCWLCNYMAESARDEIVNAGGFQAIVRAMTTHREDFKIQIGGCIAIMNLSGERGGGRGKKARAAGCETAIKKACETLEKLGQTESLAAAKLAYNRMNKKCELM